MIAAVATPAAHAAALWTGLNLLLLLVLSVLVVRQRTRHKVLLGDNGVPELIQAGRVFGNATEYVPAALAGFAVMALVGAPALVLHGLGGALFLARLLHAIGLTRSGGASFARAGGAVLTWLVYLFMGALLVFYAAP